MPLPIVGLGMDGDGIAGGVGLCSRKQSATLLQLVSAHAIGQEAELADAHQAAGQHVEQKPTHELDRIQGHDLAPAVVRIVFPLKTDAAILEGAESMVGDGHAVGVASQILKHEPGSAEGGLDVNHPFDVGSLLAQGFECRGRS